MRSKIVINSDILEEINTFNYLSFSFSYHNEIDIPGKISKFLQIMGIINRNLKSSQVQKHAILNIYNTLTLPTLLCGCENWTIKESDKSRITSAEIKFMKRTAKCTRQHCEPDEEILSHLKLTQM